MSAATIFSSSTTRMLAMALPLRPGLECDLESRSWMPPQLDRRIQLFGQCAHQLQAQRRSFSKVQLPRKSASVVADAEQVMAVVLAAQLNLHFSAFSFDEGVFERVGDQLVHDQSQRDRPIDVQEDVIGLHAQGHSLRSRALRADPIGNELLPV